MLPEQIAEMGTDALLALDERYVGMIENCYRLRDEAYASAYRAEALLAERESLRDYIVAEIERRGVK